MAPATPAAALAWRVSAAARWGVIFGAIGAMCVFVWATVTPGVLVQVTFSSGGAAWATPDVARLSLDNTVAQMLQSQAYFLAAVVVVFSLIWPYAKLLMMMYAWLAPLAASRRGALLVFLDQVGKWSLTDNFVLFLLVVLFWIRWDDAAAPGSGGQPTHSLGLSCTPATELNAFVGATILSLVLGHLMLAVHRWDCGAFLPAAGGARAPPAEPLCRMRAREGVRPAVAVAVGTALVLVATMALMFAAWCVELVEIEMDGLVGTFQDLVDHPRVQRYSVLRIVRDLGTQGSAYLQAIFVIYVLLLPALYLAALLVLWIAPLPPHPQLVLFALCQTMGAWAALDVFAVAYLGAVLGGDRFGIAQFLELVIHHQNVGPACNDLRSAGVECLVVRMTMLPAAALLLATAALYNLVGSYVYRRAYLAFQTGKASSAQVAAP